MKLMLAKDTLTIHRDYIGNILESGLSFEEAILLLSKAQGKGFSIMFSQEVKDNLIEKGYLKEGGLLSSAGKAYVKQITDLPEESAQDKFLNDEFDRFWETFPSTDKLHHFPATRSLKDNKQRCKQEFTALLSDGYTATQVTGGLEKQLENVRMQSIRENRLTYMKNSLRWLKDKEFLSWDTTAEQNDIFKQDMNVI